MQTFYTGEVGVALTNAMQLRADDAAWHRAEQEIEGVELSVESTSSCATIVDPTLKATLNYWVDGKKVTSTTATGRGLNFITFKPVTLELACNIEGFGCPRQALPCLALPCLALPWLILFVFVRLPAFHF